MDKHFCTTQADANESRAMESRDHSKNGASPKSQTSRRNFRLFQFAWLFIAGLMICSVSCKKDSGTSSSETKLKAPTGLSATEGDNKIVVSWKDVAEAESYEVYRSGSEDGTYKQIGTPDGTSYTDKKPLSGDNYYKVKAVNEDGEKSSYSKSVYCEFSGEGDGDDDDDDDDDGDDPSGDGFVVEAKNITGGNSSIANVKAMMGNFQTNEYEPIATSKYASNGFKLTLPSTVNGKYLFGFDDVADWIKASDPSATVGYIDWFIAYDGSSNMMGSFDYYGESQTVSALGMYMYASKSLNITGSTTKYNEEYSVNVTYQYDYTLKKGWNTVYTVMTYEDSGILLVETNKKPSGVTLSWSYSAFEGGGKSIKKLQNRHFGEISIPTKR